MLPGNEKCFMTSLPDTKHIFRERKIYLRNLEFRSWLRPRAVSRRRARFARNKIIAELHARAKRVRGRSPIVERKKESIVSIVSIVERKL